MNSGVELLLKRIETNPDEFWPLYREDGQSVKFRMLVESLLGVGSFANSDYGFLEPEDLKALKAAINKLRADEWAVGIFKQVMGEPEVPKLQPYQQSILNTLTAGQTQGQYAAQSATQAAQYQAAQAAQATQLHAALHQQALQQVGIAKQKAPAPTKKSHKTLFGKLFNYS